MNILAIGAHPDDVEIGCGGMLIKAVIKSYEPGEKWKWCYVDEVFIK